MYTKFNHRPEQKFAFPRKPKILTMSKSGMDQIIRLTSNPVEFEEEEFKPSMNKNNYKVFMVKRYPSQITLQEKYNQIENDSESNFQFQEYYKESKETKFLENHPDPIMTPYSLKLPPLYEYKQIQFKEPSVSDRAIFQGAKYMLEKQQFRKIRKEKTKQIETFILVNFIVTLLHALIKYDNFIIRIIQEFYYQKMSKQSISTIFQLSNGMIGSAAIVLPVLYFEYGVANAAIISFIISIAACSTALILSKHHQPTESDLSFTIQRILGQKWKILFSLSSMILLFACALINMILVCSLIYPIILLLNDDFAIQEEFTFSKFSYQWLGVIYTLLMLPSFLIKNIAPLLKLLSYGAVTIVLSVLFLIVKGSMNISNIKWFSNDLTVLPGVFGLAFLCHLLLAPVLHNQNNKNKTRDIIISYIFTYSLYQIIGIFGSMAMNGQQAEGNGSTILQYFPSNYWLVLSLQVLITLQLSLAFPVIQFVTRARFFELLYPKGLPKSRKQEILFSIIFSISCLVTQLLNTNLAFVISFTGAIIGLFLVYIIPTMMEYQYNKRKVDVLIINESQEDNSKRIPNIFLVLLNIIGISITISRFI